MFLIVPNKPQSVDQTYEPVDWEQTKLGQKRGSRGFVLCGCGLIKDWTCFFEYLGSLIKVRTYNPFIKLGYKEKKMVS